MKCHELPKIALISEYPPPAAGMTVLADELYTRLKNENVPIIKIRTNPELGVISWVDNIRVIRSLFKWLIFIINCIRIRKVDIVHIFSSSGLNFLLFTVPPVILCRFLSKRVIINYHGGGAKNYFKKHPKLLNFTMNRIDKLVVPSGYLETIFKEMGYNSIVIPNIANVERFVFRQRNNIQPVVISIRNLTVVYNIQCAVRAFAILQAKYPDAVLYVAGDGPEKQNIIKLISELKLNNVKLLGNISNDLVPVYFDKSDIFINTSNIDNMPGSILEAFASGLPVVSTNVGGIPYMVKHNESGLLAEANDHESLGKYLIEVVENEKKSLLMANSGYQYIKTLGWPDLKEMWCDLYKSLV